ncbi:glutamate receptor ionotropic, kainate 3-like [Ostrinia furnacalis]|uniref:glutamate receptor ionotropic, kainate 3-like n=1 Tax=Ostrinia furnacalis TaxID=93504 RepID=UPI00103A763B|nr:glutamate receptor ionotropic, kainate 3-like [Ostrinia furnacalis]
MGAKILCFVVVAAAYVFAEDLRIGGIFYEDAEDLKEAFTLSAKLANFTPTIKEVSKRGEILEVRTHVCELADEGVIGIIDGVGGRGSEIIQSLCDIMELPHVLLRYDFTYPNDWSLLNLYPSPEVYNNVVEQLVLQKQWKNFTLLYIRGRSLFRLHSLLQMGNDTDRLTIGVRELSGSDYRDVLINAKDNGYVNFIVDCPSRHLEQLLRQAQQVGLMADEHSYIILSPDLFTLDMERYRYGGVNMTGFRLMDLKTSENLWEFTNHYNAETGKTLQPEQLKTELLLVYDAMKVFEAALKKLQTLTVQSLKCEDFEAWTYGSSLQNFMKTNKVEGLTRTLLFNGLGDRTDVTFDVLELTSSGNQTIGTWKANILEITRPKIPDGELTENTALTNKTLKVLITTTGPYGYLKDSEHNLVGNDRYEGFSIDLIAKIAEILGFSYEFEVEEDNGKIVNGKWTGMPRKLMNDDADLAICDFTITALRQSVIDFSTPFMSLGIGILYKQPSKQPPEMFSFMAVFSKEVWYYMVLIQLLLGCVMIFVGRISHKEWQNLVPCIESPEELSNQFSFANSVWLIIGSVMQQGSEIAPIAVAPRMITSIWWFFTMVMVASYVGTLVAFLTVEKNVLPFQNVEELFKHKSISYGAKEGGSTHEFFVQSKHEIYKKMNQKMTAKGWLVQSNQDGVNLVENSTYAFFMESTSIEYTKQRHCDLLQIGGLLDSKSYGIGMKKNSTLKVHIDRALLMLKERGEIKKLKDLWWNDRRGGGNCDNEVAAEEKQLGMKNMLGAFVVLGVGCLIGLFISTLDMLWGVFKRSVKYGTTFKYELVEELKFALKFSGDVKPVKRPEKTDGSQEALAEAEKKDEIKSLKSLSRRSTSTHKSHHSHSSRHSPRDLSVAFAKRREY